MQIKSYTEAVEFIHGRRKFTKSPDLERMRRFAHYLGDPQKKTKFIHVTGTNGKGSTVAFLSELLQSQGFRVGTFTSPYITRFNERIALDGEPISDQMLVELLNELLPVISRLDEEYAGEGPKEFEVVTMLMFLYFAKMAPDYAVVEVGIGGLYDSTNILIPELAVITEVALDHTQILGDTLAKIATAKAGIIKQDRPVVVGKLVPECLAVIKAQAVKRNAPLYQAGVDYTFLPEKSASVWGESFTYQGFGIKAKLAISLLGQYQVANASLAVSAFLVLAKREGFSPTLKEIKTALKQTTWAGRFEKINDEPLIVLDGAHNADAIQQLVQTLKHNFADKQIYVIISVLADKQAKTMVAELEQLPNVELFTVSFDAPRAVSHEQDRFYEAWPEALAEVMQEISSDDMLLFTGSLYFVSEVRNYFI